MTDSGAPLRVSDIDDLLDASDLAIRRDSQRVRDVAPLTASLRAYDIEVQFVPLDGPIGPNHSVINDSLPAPLALIEQPGRRGWPSQPGLPLQPSTHLGRETTKQLAAISVS